MQYYVHKNAIVTVNVAEDDGILHTISGNFPVKKGEYFITNQSNESIPISKEIFERDYVPIKIKKKKPKIDYEEMAKYYMEMGELIRKENEGLL